MGDSFSLSVNLPRTLFARGHETKQAAVIEVAAFEYADSTRKNENLSQEGLRDPEDEFGNLASEARESSELGRNRRPGVGFDDFDDEDDLDSYEIDETRDREVPVAEARSSFASEEFSEDEQFPESKAGFNAHRGGSSKL